MPTRSPSGRPSRADALVGPLVERDPGRRVPGAADGFELAVRAVIGQQVSVSGARTVAAKLVEAAGDALPEPDGAVTHLFPTPTALVELAGRDPGAFAMPAGRRHAIAALAAAVVAGDVVIDPGADPLEVRRSLVRLPGIGPWTAEYVAMRALRDPDAFMPTDLGIRRAARAIGLPDDPGPARRAERSAGGPGAATPWPTSGRSRRRPPRSSPRPDPRKDVPHEPRPRPDPTTMHPDHDHAPDRRSDGSCSSATATY